jgi:uncharacterized protein
MSSAVYEEVSAMVGQEAPISEGIDEVNAAMIRHWCEAMEDGNPLYTDKVYAEEGEYGTLIAPPQMVMSFCMAPIWPPQEEVPNPFNKAVEKMADAGLFGVVATKTSYEFFAPMKVGDRISIIRKLASVSPEKKTRVGTGHFVTAEQVYSNQNNETVAVQMFTVLTFKP